MKLFALHISCLCDKHLKLHTTTIGKLWDSLDENDEIFYEFLTNTNYPITLFENHIERRDSTQVTDYLTRRGVNIDVDRHVDSVNLFIEDLYSCPDCCLKFLEKVGTASQFECLAEESKKTGEDPRSIFEDCVVIKNIEFHKGSNILHLEICGEDYPDITLGWWTNPNFLENVLGAMDNQFSTSNWGAIAGSVLGATGMYDRQILGEFLGGNDD